MPRSLKHNHFTMLIISSMPAARRFPPPWSIEEANNACFIVRDSTGQALAYFYFEDEHWSALGNQAAHQRRGAADGAERRQAAGTIAQVTVL